MVKKEEKSTKKTFSPTKQDASVKTVETVKSKDSAKFSIGGRTFKTMTDRVSGYKKHLKDK